MRYIYKITNQINKKIYIGQTNDMQKRLNGHKSKAYNKKAHDYNSPLYKEIRKYGWDNFCMEKIESSPEGLDEKQEREWSNEREKYYISLFNSLVKSGGYNITESGFSQNKMSFHQKINTSKKFSLNDVLNIQILLLKGTTKVDILKKYSPDLTESFLDNINYGLNFFNENLSYPLFNYKENRETSWFSPEEQKAIQQEIIVGIFYKEISKRHNISMGMLSLINNGSYWYNSELKYPLCVKGSSRKHNWENWVQDVIRDLKESKLTIKEVAKKYNKAISTIKKINYGSSYRQSDTKYPLRKTH